MAGEQREEWRGRYNVTLCSYCLMTGEKREEWRGDIMGHCAVTVLWQEKRERSGGEDTK